jgi:hypothetical protein
MRTLQPRLRMKARRIENICSLLRGLISRGIGESRGYSVLLQKLRPSMLVLI